jgi:hypothetical protein
MTQTMRHPLSAAMPLVAVAFELAGRGLNPGALLPSPCQQHGVSPDGSAFPCLKYNWRDRRCPVNAAVPGWMKTSEAQMHALGYPYAAWVIRKRLFGISTGCSLQFVREVPTKENAVELFGSHVRRVTRAI